MAHYYERFQLIHYVGMPVKLGSRNYVQPGIHGRPGGLWLSVEDGNGWREYCKVRYESALAYQEIFDTHDPQADMPSADATLDAQGWLDIVEHRHVVALSQDAHVLSIESREDATRFWDKYFAQDQIDWKRVAKHWQGVFVAPFEREIGFDSARKMGWYLMWDCSSGCIWDLSAIQWLEKEDD